MKHSRQLPPNEPNIYRYTHNGATSWVVQVMRAGNEWVEFFADGDDGPWVSHARAKTWLRELKGTIPPLNKLHRRSSTSRTGIIGVMFTNDRTRAGNRVRRWVAVWPKPSGGMRKRSFSVLKYGERRAKALAIEARKQGVEELLAARARTQR